MATRTFCDACGKEGANYQFEHLYHIDGLASGQFCDYADSDGNAISGIHVSKDLCNECYNAVMVAAVEKFNNIREKNKHD